jgi:hypothetical protein
MSFGSLPSVLGNGGGVAISVIGGTGLFADGTAAAPSIAFASDPDTGFYRGGTNILASAVGGAVAWSIYATGGSTYFQAANSTGLYAKAVGEIGLFAGGTNQNITLTPSNDGFVAVGDGAADTRIKIRSSTPYAIGVGRGVSPNGFYFLGGTASATPDLVFSTTAGVETARLTNGGRFLLGTSSVDSGALLQVGTNTTNSAGGMVFGTDTFLYRSQPGGLILSGTSNATFVLSGSSANAQLLQFLQNSVEVGRIGFSSSANLILATGGNVTALTLDATQNATFAGKLNFGGTSASFPQLARAGAELTVQLADGSAFGYLKAKLRASNGSAGANFSGVPVSITVVDGVVTAVS